MPRRFLLCNLAFGTVWKNPTLRTMTFKLIVHDFSLLGHLLRSGGDWLSQEGQVEGEREGGREEGVSGLMVGERPEGPVY